MNHFASLKATRYTTAKPPPYTTEQLEVATAMVEAAASIWRARKGERFYYSICDKALRAVSRDPADRWAQFREQIEELAP